MGLLTYTNLQDNTPATANMFNSRFGAIHSVLNGGIEGVNLAPGAVTIDKIATNVFEKFWPIGSIYQNATDDTNPAVLLGFGVWQAYGKGRFIVGFDDTQTEFNAAGKQGGEKAVTLTTAEMPVHNHNGQTDTQGAHAHNHESPGGQKIARITNNIDNNHGFIDSYDNGVTDVQGAHHHNFVTNNTGGGGAHNNLPPFTTAYVWERIS